MCVCVFVDLGRQQPLVYQLKGILMYRFVNAFALLVLTVGTGCTINEQGSDSIVNPAKGPVFTGNTIQVSQRPPTTIVFDRLRRIHDVRCPNSGPNCAVVCPKPPRAVLDEVDISISNGPAGVGAFFPTLVHPGSILLRT